MKRRSLPRLALATLAMVVAAAGVPNPAVAVEPTTGTVTGRFVDRAGIGLGSFNVHITGDDGGGSHLFTDADGRFSAQVQPGSYRVSFHKFEDGATFTQFVPGTDVYSEATVFEVAAGETVTVNDTMYATGIVVGTFTDAQGHPMRSVEVTVSRGMEGAGGYTMTDDAGQFRLAWLRAGSAWRVQFRGFDPYFEQYAYGAVNLEQATLISIVEGQTTVVNDSKLPTGSVRVVAKDESGSAIPTFYASLDSAGYADGEDGEAVIADVPVGTHPLGISAMGFEQYSGSVSVVEGQQTEVVVTMIGKSRIEATVVDAATGEPVPGVCLVVARPPAFDLPDGCSSKSSASGKVVMETPGAGWFQVFAFPADAPGYGAQWVGATSGSGSQLAAKLIRVAEGEAGVAPVIKMDRAGTVIGKVTQSDGTVQPWGTVSVGSFSTYVGPGIGTAPVDEQGQYTIDFLGPYEWPLMFWAGRDGTQFSGGVGNRFLAETVKVESGQQITFDHQHRAPVQLTADINGITGGCDIFAVNAITGDTVMAGWSEDCTQPVTDAIVGPQFVKFRVNYDDEGQWRRLWVGGDDFAHATPYFIPGRGTKSITVNF